MDSAMTRNVLRASAVVLACILAGPAIAKGPAGADAAAVLRSPFPDCGVVRRFDTYSFHTKDKALKALRSRMFLKRSVPTVSLRRLADMGDRLAAFKLGKLAEESDTPNAASDAIHYYSVAAYLGQKSAVMPLVGLLRVDAGSAGPTRLENAERALISAARRGDADAMLALGTFYRDGVPFPKQPEIAFAFLCRAAVNGNASAAFMVGNDLVQNRASTPEQRKFGKQLIGAAAHSGDLVAAAILRNLEQEP